MSDWMGQKNKNNLRRNIIMKTLEQHLNESLNIPYFYEGTIDDLIGMLCTLRMNTQTVHWNYTGENFLSFHKYLDEVLEYVDEYVDKLAENQRTKNLECRNPYFQIDKSQVIITENEVATIVNTYFKYLQVVGSDVSKLLTAIGTVEAPGKHWDKVNEDILINLKTELDKSIWWIKSTFSNLQ